MSCFYIFPNIDTFWRLCSRRLLKTLWQCSKQAISPFAKVFSTWFNYYVIIYWDYLQFCEDFSVVCCRFAVCWKWLNLFNFQTHMQQTTWKGLNSVETLWQIEKLLLLPKCFQKLSASEASKWIWRLSCLIAWQCSKTWMNEVLVLKMLILQFL